MQSLCWLDCGPRCGVVVNHLFGTQISSFIHHTHSPGDNTVLTSFLLL
ncbi:hypothetical protein HanPI659440_Chr15g0576061 [Helianthus annuus]|nr:hypothetical protein HanPI659440_Chr15g0576061 [Helianthus annuus]